MDTIRKTGEGSESQSPLNLTLYAEAAIRFRGSAEAFMQHVHILAEARNAYQEAISASAAMRERLDAEDQVLRSIMAQLEQIVLSHLSDKKKPELVKMETARASIHRTEPAS